MRVWPHESVRTTPPKRWLASSTLICTEDFSCLAKRDR